MSWLSRWNHRYMNNKSSHYNNMVFILTIRMTPTWPWVKQMHDVIMRCHWHKWRVLCSNFVLSQTLLIQSRPDFNPSNKYPTVKTTLITFLPFPVIPIINPKTTFVDTLNFLFRHLTIMRCEAIRKLLPVSFILRQSYFDSEHAKL